MIIRQQWIIIIQLKLGVDYLGKLILIIILYEHNYLDFINILTFINIIIIISYLILSMYYKFKS